MSHNTYTTKNGQTIRLINNRVLVQLEKPQEASASGLVLYPNGSMENVNTFGRIMAYGFILPKEGPDSGKRLPIPGLEVGKRVVFIRFLANQHTNESIRALLGDDLVVIAPSDIAAIADSDVPMHLS